MPESKQIGRGTIDTLGDNFLEAIRKLSAFEGYSPDEQAQAIEHIGVNLRDECCSFSLRGHAIWAMQILTIATTRRR